MSNDELRTIRYKDIEVVWTPKLSGGGLSYGQQYVPVIRKLFGKVNRLHEFCAGPGFIGFSLLAEGLCESLCLTEINPAAIEVLEETVRRNNLQDKVRIYKSDGLNDVPENEKWDFVVANPPHFGSPTAEGIITNDTGWKIHQDFYLNVHKHLTPHATVLFQENYIGSNEADFIPFLEKGRLEYVDSFMYKPDMPSMFNPYYFFWVRLMHSEFAWKSANEKTINILLSTPSDTYLKTGEKYRFKFHNDLSEKIEITFIDEIGKNMSRVLPIASLMPTDVKQTESILFTQGKFELVDLAKKKSFGMLIIEN